MQRNDAIGAIKQRLNIVDIVRRYVDLKRNGPRWVAPCPFHQETKPSFSVNEEEGLFYCFGCHASGDIFDFYGRINGLDFRDTLDHLAAEAGIELDQWRGQGKSGAQVREQRSKRQSFLRMYQLAAAHFARNLREPDAEECRAYVQRRGIPQSMIDKFGLGWSKREWHDLGSVLSANGFNDALAIESGLLGRSEKSGRGYDRFRGRLMFPIRDLSQSIIAFGGRIIGGEDEAKYINSVDSPIYKKGDHLYGLAQARKGITLKGKALLTEGYMDVLTLHQFGYEHAVGVLGTALTPEQVKRLSGFTSNLVLLFDGDRAGRKAALRSCEMLLVKGLSCKVVLLPEGEDIDSLLRTQGPEAFDALEKSAPEGLRFCTDVLREQAPREAVAWAKTFLKQVEIPELISPFVSHLTRHLDISEQDVREGLAQSRQDRQHTHPTPQGKMPRKTPTAERDRQILMFAVRYPQRLPDLRERGVDLALTTTVAKNLWQKLETYNETEIVCHLDAREKGFWVRTRTEGAPLLGNEEKELTALLEYMDRFDKTVQKSSLSAALRENAGTGDFHADLEYLRALQETLGRTDE